MGIKKWRQPDLQWILALLSILDPDHPFFAKDYVPVKEVDDAKEVELVDNNDGFFDSLPTIKLSKKESKKRVCKAVVDDSSSQIQKLEKWKVQKNQIKRKIKKLQKEKDSKENSPAKSSSSSFVKRMNDLEINQPISNQSSAKKSK